jgi:general stress protein 26
MMIEPTTELDDRFSDTDASATSWEHARSVLESAQLAWLTTVRGDGRPHVTPLVPVWFDDAVYITTGPTEQKHRNLGSNSAVALTTGCANWDSGLDVVLEGRAVRVRDRALLERLAVEWRSKWDGASWEFEASDDGFTHDEGGRADVFEIRPTKVLAFGKGTFTHTRHVFGH